ncbi:phosphoribosyltransferase [Nitrosophilus labii]|uniref:phosphoribosyltransferase n=1 Tax=Nitrosophilus labii TaxID=2706014 RepID=UPI0016574991|nr:phosphoribosyltransferase family protein [Nitrosophilus labii]
MVFRDRFEAAQLLAEKLKDYIDEKSVVVALPRGGVPLAFVISKKYQIPMNIYFVKKIPSPYNPEAAIGAISEDGDIFTDKKAKLMLNVADQYIDELAQKKKEEMRAKRRLYKKEKTDLKGKNVILVDDGIATGASMFIAAKSIKNMGADRVIIASPVAPPEVVTKLKNVADEVVLLQTPPDFMAVGQFYQDFHQLSDDEVIELLSL